jgi:hypothetical protein
MLILTVMSHREAAARCGGQSQRGRVLASIYKKVDRILAAVSKKMVPKIEVIALIHLREDNFPQRIGMPVSLR